MFVPHMPFDTNLVFTLSGLCLSPRCIREFHSDVLPPVAMLWVVLVVCGDASLTFADMRVILEPLAQNTFSCI